VAPVLLPKLVGRRDVKYCGGCGRRRCGVPSGPDRGASRSPGLHGFTVKAIQVVYSRCGQRL
jgi:hypothetical protein